MNVELKSLEEQSMSEKCIKCAEQLYEECLYFGGNVIHMEDCGINFDHCTQFHEKEVENDPN